VTYSFTDQDGNRLEVTPARDGHAVNLTTVPAGTHRRSTVTIPAWRLGDVVAAMYRGAGETVPVMINPDEVAEDWVHVTGTRGAA
jgi:hypothetical protein